MNCTICNWHTMRKTRRNRTFLRVKCPINTEEMSHKLEFLYDVSPVFCGICPNFVAILPNNVEILRNLPIFMMQLLPSFSFDALAMKRVGAVSTFNLSN